jgi:hypothetical protein
MQEHSRWRTAKVAHDFRSAPLRAAAIRPPRRLLDTIGPCLGCDFWVVRSVRGGRGGIAAGGVTAAPAAAAELRLAGWMAGGGLDGGRECRSRRSRRPRRAGVQVAAFAAAAAGGLR